MARGLGTLVIDLIAKTGGFETDMGRAARIADRRAKEIERNFKRAGAVIGTAIAAGATAAAFAIKSAINDADQLSKLSQKIGISTEALSGLRIAAELSDVSLQQLQGGIQRLVTAQTDAARGSKEQADLFRALGIEAKNADGTLRDSVEVLNQVSDLFATLPDGATKTAVAVKLFGRSGAELIPLLNQGSEGLAKFDKMAAELGLRLDSETGKAAEDFNDNLTLLKLSLQGVALEVARGALPNLKEFVQTLNDPSIREGFRVIIQGAVDAVTALSKLAAEFGNFSRFLGEEFAARINGPALDDVVRLSERLGEIDNKLRQLRGGVIASGLPLIGRGDLIKQLEAERAQIQAALDFAEQSAASASRGVAGSPPAASSAPAGFDAGFFANQTEITKATKAAEKAKREAAQAADQFAKSLQSLRLEMASPLQRAIDENNAALAEFEGLAVKGGVGATDLAAAQELLAEKLRRTKEAFADQFASIVAQLDGPVAEAQLAYQRRLKEIEEAGIAAGASAEQIAAAIGKETEAYNLRREAIERQLNPAIALIEDMEFELHLLGLTNAEREKEIALRYAGANATDAQKQKIGELVDAMEQERKRIAFFDDIRSASDDLFSSIIDGSKSALDALKDFADQIQRDISRRIAQSFTDMLFGEPGQSSQGASGNILGSIFGALFGGGRASGGPVLGGTTYLVGERGPELFVPATAGAIIPNHAMPRTGGSVTNNFAIVGPVDRRTQQQIAQAAQEGQQRAMRRNV